MQSGAVPGTFWISNRGNQEPNEDRSEMDVHLAIGTSDNRYLQFEFGPRWGIIHAVRSSGRNPGFSSSQQKKGRSSCQPHLRSWSPFRQLKQTRFFWPFNSWRETANFNNNNNKVSNLPNSLTNTMPTFNGKSDKLELFVNPCQTSFRTHN